MKILCVGCKADWREIGTTPDPDGWHNCSGYMATDKCECEECIERIRAAQERLKKDQDLFSEFLKTFPEWKKWNKAYGHT